MPEEERLRLLAIAERIALVRSWVEDVEEAKFLADLKGRDAAAMSLLVIGETARRLLDDTKARSGDPLAGDCLPPQSYRPRLRNGRSSPGVASLDRGFAGIGQRG